MPRIVKCACGGDVGVLEDRMGARGACVWCGSDLVVRPENSRTVPTLGVTTPRMETDSLPEPWETSSAMLCSRCRQPFRGDWDRNLTDDGVICHRCKNQWRPPATADPYIMPSPAVREAESDFNPPPLSTTSQPVATTLIAMDLNRRPGKRPTDLRAHWWQRHRGKLLYVVGAALLVLGLTILPLGDLIAFMFGNEAAKTGAPLSFASGLFLWMVRGLCAVLKVFIPLYLGLHVADALPNDSVRNNLLAVGAVSVLLSLIGLFHFIPMYGTLGFILQLVIIMYLYDIDTGDFAKFLLVFLVTSGVVALAAAIVVGGTYGLLAGLGT